MTQHAKKTIFIVCEGSGTEPNYFGAIRDYIIDKGLNAQLSIRISPLPKNEQDVEFHLRANATKRQLKKLSDEKERDLERYEITEDYRAQPTRYVREAQLGLEDGTFDEVWAVFDKDGHPRHKEAFELAEKEVNGKKVNIAFSSIAFEYWVILHFEQLYLAFVKSQCREANLILKCGSGEHPNDCQGNQCACGYLIQRLLPSYSKGTRNLFDNIGANTPTAIENSVWLRRNIPIDDQIKPVYELNPYTNLDHLVFTLMMTPKGLTWFNRIDTITINGISFFINKVDNMLHIRISNANQPARVIVNEDSFFIANSKGELMPIIERTLLDDKELSKDIDLNDVKDFFPLYILYKKGGNEYLIADL